LLLLIPKYPAKQQSTALPKELWLGLEWKLFWQSCALLLPYSAPSSGNALILLPCTERIEFSWTLFSKPQIWFTLEHLCTKQFMICVANCWYMIKHGYLHNT
jgi:hypothetical protein